MGNEIQPVNDRFIRDYSVCVKGQSFASKLRIKHVVMP